MGRDRPVQKTAVILLASAGISLLCAYSTCVWKREGPETATDFWTLFLATLVGLVLSFSLPVVLAGLALFRSLGATTKSQGLMILLLSYLSIVISFSALYYVISWQADLEDAEKQFPYYNDLRVNWPNREVLPAFRTSSYRAFRGIEGRLWNGVESAARPPDQPKDMDASVAQIYEKIDWVRKQGQPSFVVTWSGFPTQYQVYLDCLHYSIVTMSTVGYGDITPRSRIAKVITDLQILVSQGLFLFALGYVFGKSENKTWGGMAKPVDAGSIHGP